MSPKLSEAEKIVIGVIFKNPKANLVEIAKVLDKSEYPRKKTDINADVRTVSKFKSVGLKKIRKGLNELADTSRLDRSIQKDEDKERIDILQKNGILYGHDFRIDRKVYIFYTLQEDYILWQEHVCNVRCQNQCETILNLIRKEHKLDKLKNNKLTRDQFEDTFDEIVMREEGKKPV